MSASDKSLQGRAQVLRVKPEAAINVKCSGAGCLGPEPLMVSIVRGGPRVRLYPAYKANAVFVQPVQHKLHRSEY